MLFAGDKFSSLGMIILRFRRAVDGNKKLKRMGFRQGSLVLTPVNTPLLTGGVKDRRQTSQWVKIVFRTAFYLAKKTCFLHRVKEQLNKTPLLLKGQVP